MRDTEFDDQLLSQLEQERTSIPDDGFTNSVMRVLPPKGGAGLWLRQAILPGMTLAGCWLGLIALPGGEYLHKLLAQLPHAQFISSLPLPWLILVYAFCWTAVAGVLETRQRSASRTRPGLAE